MSTLIAGGRVITALDDYIADVFIRDGRIALIGDSLDVEADSVIDAADKYIFPGGVDVHTHMDMPFGGTVTCDDFTSGTTSAAFGGTTTIVDFCLQQPGQTFPEALDTWHQKLRDHPPVIDVGFHLAVTDLKEAGTLSDLETTASEGVTSFKLFMAYKNAIMIDDETLFKAMRVAARTGAVVMVHAENGDAIDVLVQEARQRGDKAPRFHASTRPPITEGEATNRAIQLARLADCAVYVVHVSCEEAIEPIARAREAGWNAWGETCPHYLLIDETYLERPDFEGAKYVYTPPPRPKRHQSPLWDALRRDVLSIVSTDHAPFNFGSQKVMGKDDFSLIPNGPPGIEERLKILHEAGVRQGRIDLNRLVALWATNPAKLFGLYPRKGTISIGSDADLVIFDSTKQETLSVASHHSNCDYNLYEGLEVTGVPEITMVRGNVVVSDGELRDVKGEFIRRAPFAAPLAPKPLKAPAGA